MTLTNRTKIVATIGPASSAPAVLRRLMEAGVDVFRLNFSHGSMARTHRNLITTQASNGPAVIWCIHGRVGTTR
jgi:pyruvate kinase